MKKIILASALAVFLISGCSHTPQVSQQQMIEKYKALPEWVNNDSSAYSAVGSATPNGQNFNYLKLEAITLAKANLAHKISAKIDAMNKSYHASTGQSDAVQEDVFMSSSKQVSSEILNACFVTKTYMANDGELFVEVTLKPDEFESILKNRYKSQAYIYQNFRADTEWKNLKTEVDALPQNKN